MDDSPFDSTWRRLAERGACDGWGGAEYRRVKVAWELMGKGHNLEQFIRLLANMLPLSSREIAHPN